MTSFNQRALYFFTCVVAGAVACSGTETAGPDDSDNTSTGATSITSASVGTSTTIGGISSAAVTGGPTASTGTSFTATVTNTGSTTFTAAGSMGTTASTTAPASSTSSTSSGTGGASSTTAASTSQTASGGSGGGAGMEFALTSSELSEGGAFMDKHTCALTGFDNDESPPLSWSGAPANTQSFAIVFLDTTLTEQGDTLGYHWVMWDIPASVNELPANLPEGATLTTPVSAKQYSPASPSYLGPCPNFGSSGETHTYTFTIYAMPEAETTALAGLNDVQALESAIQAVAIDSASLSGTSDASPP